MSNMSSTSSSSSSSSTPTPSPTPAPPLPARGRIERLLAELQRGIYDKATEIHLALLAALGGESLLLLGPPGVAKSMVARRVKGAFRGARSFEYLMSRFSTPDELFGPVSIARLKENDKFERATEGYLPTADVAFLDEIWKAGPAIQNTLLTVMNERLFRNGDREERVPLKLLVAASNELPARDEGLEALWDRFLVRIVCRPIADEQTFRAMLCAPEEAEADEVDEALALTAEEYAACQRAAARVRLSPATLDAVSHLRQALRGLRIEGVELPRAVYVSDRRWRHIARLVRTSAAVQGRTQTRPADLLPLHRCLWNEPEETERVREAVVEALFAPAEQALDRLATAVKTDLRAHAARAALIKARRENDHRDDHLAVIDRLFYHVQSHGTGRTLVFITDFKRMPARSTTGAPAQGLLYTEPGPRGRTIVRLSAPGLALPATAAGSEHVTLCRDDRYIYINGVRYAMRRADEATLSPAGGTVGAGGAGGSLNTAGTVGAGGGLFSEKDFSLEESAAPALPPYEAEIEAVVDMLTEVEQQAADNLFAPASDRRVVADRLNRLYKQVALVRVDIRKLLYDEE